MNIDLEILTFIILNNVTFIKLFFDCLDLYVKYRRNEDPKGVQRPIITFLCATLQFWTTFLILLYWSK